MIIVSCVYQLNTLNLFDLFLYLEVLYFNINYLVMTKQYLLQRQRDNNLANVNNGLRPINTSDSNLDSNTTGILVDHTSEGNNSNLRGSGINRMSCKTHISNIRIITMSWKLNINIKY